MRKISVLLIAAAVATSLGAGLCRAQDRVAPPVDASILAARVAGELRGHMLYGSSRADWRTRVPHAAWRDRRGGLEYPPESALPKQRGLWCSEATDVSDGVSREVVFYGLRTERPYDCRAEQIRYVIDVTGRTDDAYTSLAEGFRREFSGGEFSKAELFRPEDLAVSLDLTSRTAYRSDEWNGVIYWMEPTQFVLLFRAGHTVQVIGQTYILVNALRADMQRRGSLERYGLDLWTWELVNALRPRDPEAVDLILSNPNRAGEQPLVERVALRLLQAYARSSRAEDRAMWALAAGIVVQKIRVEGERPELARPSLAPLLRFGVQMDESPYDQGIWYASWGPSSRERRTFAATRWSQWTVESGNAPASSQYADEYQYRAVIANGTAWLEGHPRSPMAIAVMTDVAQAYETWWSLSLAPDDEELLTASDHHEGSENARRQSIRWYERIIREFPNSREAEYARRVLIQIRVGVDTGSRAFFSPYA
jgi:hypothetical protein